MKLFYTSLSCFWAVCILQTIFSVSGKLERHEDVGVRRTAREAGAPAPIDCKLTTWSAWSECDPCTHEKYRSRGIEIFGQYGGKACLEPLGNVATCRPSRPCVEEEIDCGMDFKCETGRCIKKRLECNGDNDCGDYSDENCDKEPKTPCRNLDLEVSELGRTAGWGYNVLGMQTTVSPFDNEFYNGICDRVRDGNTRTYFRKPWNVVQLAYETKADESFTTEVYEDSTSLVTEVFSETTSSFGLELSIKVTPTEIQNVNISGTLTVGLTTNKTESLKTIKEYSTQSNKVFMHVKGKVQLGRFQMRTRDAMLTNPFFDALKALPSKYEKGEYFRFIEEYGTHYSVSGSVGGKYELIYVLNKAEMKKKEISTHDVKNCLGYSIKVDATVTHKSPDPISVKGGLQGDECKKMTEGATGTDSHSGIIDKVIVMIDGGTVAFAALLKGKLEMKQSIDVNVYYEWAKSLQDAPVLIQLRPNPIHTLIPIKMKDAQEKKENLERAIDDYIAEYNVCKCRPCQNGGTVVLVDGECSCKCLKEYTGIDCQTLKANVFESQKKVPVINGNWGCWSGWTACISGEHSRTRKCNNPAPGPGGAPCIGEGVTYSHC